MGSHSLIERFVLSVHQGVGLPEHHDGLRVAVHLAVPGRAEVSGHPRAAAEGRAAVAQLALRDEETDVGVLRCAQATCLEVVLHESEVLFLVFLGHFEAADVNAHGDPAVIAPHLLAQSVDLRRQIGDGLLRTLFHRFRKRGQHAVDEAVGQEFGKLLDHVRPHLGGEVLGQQVRELLHEPFRQRRDDVVARRLLRVVDVGLGGERVPALPDLLQRQDAEEELPIPVHCVGGQGENDELEPPGQIGKQVELGDEVEHLGSP